MVIGTEKRLVTGLDKIILSVHWQCSTNSRKWEVRILFGWIEAELKITVSSNSICQKSSYRLQSKFCLWTKNDICCTIKVNWKYFILFLVQIPLFFFSHQFFYATSIIPGAISLLFHLNWTIDIVAFKWYTLTNLIFDKKVEKWNHGAKKKKYCYLKIKFTL